MAVAGLRNASVFGPSSFGDSQLGRPSTRASTLLQLWQEVEGEQLNGQLCGSRRHRNGPDSEHLDIPTSVGQGSDNGNDISQDSNKSENQCFIGFRMEHGDNNSVMSEQSSDLGEVELERVRQVFREWISSDSKSGCHMRNHSGLWLGENEYEKVRIIREWMQMSSQQRNSCGLLRDRFAEVGSVIEQVRDGLVINQPDVDARKPILRLCGRQAILDLLQRGQRERRREILGLLEQRPVSDFAYRNRIQALLKGRFLRNKRLVVDERPSSAAANELGLLRQRHTVSDLREGFLSKLDNSACNSNNPNSNSAYCGEHFEEADFTCGEREDASVHVPRDLESAACGSRNLHEFQVKVTYAEEPVMSNEGTEQEVSLGVGTSDSQEVPAMNTEGRQEEIVTDTDHCRGIEQSETYEPLLESAVIHFNGLVTGFEQNASSDLVSRDASAQIEVFQKSVAIEDESRSWEESSANQWSPEASHNNVEEHQLQESEPSHELQEASADWLDMRSRAVGGSIGGVDSFYFPEDDENARSWELSELFSRHRVSSLLRSGFRESLDQVLQSQVDRLGNDSGDWEQDSTFSPEFSAEQEQDQLYGDQTSTISDGYERNPLAPSSTVFTASQQIRDELQGAGLPHRSEHQLHPEWEVINELRLDIAQLHQRMNHMESVLEECMDMQIELQSFIRHEVSAALNRDNFSRSIDKTPDHHGKLDQRDDVRKGICCLCQDNKIDSLLYRCGHMCTCSKCAGNLTRHKGKCPMCLAPVVEVVRAYLVH